MWQSCGNRVATEWQSCGNRVASVGQPPQAPQAKRLFCFFVPAGKVSDRPTATKAASRATLQGGVDGWSRLQHVEPNE